MVNDALVGGLVAINFIFRYILGFDYHPIIDEVIFSRGEAQPPSSFDLIFLVPQKLSFWRAGSEAVVLFH